MIEKGKERGIVKKKIEESSEKDEHEHDNDEIRESEGGFNYEDNYDNDDNKDDGDIKIDFSIDTSKVDDSASNIGIDESNEETPITSTTNL